MHSNQVYPPPPDAAYPPPPAYSGGEQHHPPPPAYQPHGYQAPPPNYGQPITGQPSQTVVVVAPQQYGPHVCPHCGGRRMNHVTLLGCLFCIFCFPIGMIICCLLMEERCQNCGK